MEMDENEDSQSYVEIYENEDKEMNEYGKDYDEIQKSSTRKTNGKCFILSDIVASIEVCSSDKQSKESHSSEEKCDIRLDNEIGSSENCSYDHDKMLKGLRSEKENYNEDAEPSESENVSKNDDDNHRNQNESKNGDFISLDTKKEDKMIGSNSNAGIDYLQNSHVKCDNGSKIMQENDDEMCASDCNKEDTDKKTNDSKFFKVETTLTLFVNKKGKKIIRKKCPFCDKFVRPSNLPAHLRTHTGERPFKCFVCEKRFSLKQNMNNHIRTHTKEKPFECSLCDKRFTMKQQLTCHMRTHTKEKPFECPVCEKKFSLKQHLDYHLKTHTDENKLDCIVCGRTFSRKQNLAIHLRKHQHKEELSQCMPSKNNSHE